MCVVCRLPPCTAHLPLALCLYYIGYMAMVMYVRWNGWSESRYTRATQLNACAAQPSCHAHSKHGARARLTLPLAARPLAHVWALFVLQRLERPGCAVRTLGTDARVHYYFVYDCLSAAPAGGVTHTRARVHRTPNAICKTPATHVCVCARALAWLAASNACACSLVPI